MDKADKILKSTEKFKIKLGLERIKHALSLFENPQNKMEFIHIAGTNGKGSTAAIIEQILLEDKRRIVGKYTSPHLFSYTERFSVNGVNITEDELDELVNIVNEKDKENSIGLSEFEILTVVCFLYFEKHNVEIAILETGLGGRLDATNVIEHPLCSIITSISYDHKERLGDTIEKIAHEKAGIFKKGCNAIFLKENKGYNELLNCANSIGAKVIEDNIEVFTEGDFAVINNEKTPFNLNGDFQKENLKLALLAIKNLPFKIDKKTIKDALKNVKWRFRMEKCNYKGHNLLIDGCHNPDGARVLSEYLSKYYKNKKIKIIFGCLKNKDFKGILGYLYNESYKFYFYEFNYPNALKYEELGEYKKYFINIKDPFDEIFKNDYDLCTVCGSLYMLGNIFKEKQI